MTITARTAPKLCAHIRAALPEIFLLDLISLVIYETMEPWPECQPEESRPREARPEDSSICIYIYIYIPGIYIYIYIHINIYIYIYIY